jgi:hypothetical protein
MAWLGLLAMDAYYRFLDIPSALSKALPSFCCLPLFVRGIPIFLDKLPFAAEVPNSLRQLNPPKFMFHPFRHFGAASHPLGASAFFYLPQ